MLNTQHVGTITRCRENAVHKFWSFWITSVMSWYLFSFWGTSGALSWTVRLEYIAEHNVTYGQVSPCCRSSAILANSSRKPFPQPGLYVIDSCVANINVPDCPSPWATVSLVRNCPGYALVGNEILIQLKCLKHFISRPAPFPFLGWSLGYAFGDIM